MEKERLSNNVQIATLSLEEAVDLYDLLKLDKFRIDEKGIVRYYCDAKQYTFMGFREILGLGNLVDDQNFWYMAELDKNTGYTGDAWGRTLCGFDIYAVRKPENSKLELELAPLGSLTQHPQIMEFIKEYKKIPFEHYDPEKCTRLIKKLSDKHLIKPVKKWVDKHTLGFGDVENYMEACKIKINLEDEVIALEDSKKLGFCGDEEKFERFVKNRKQTIKNFKGYAFADDYFFGKEWKLARIDILPGSTCGFHIGIPEPNDVFVFSYEGSDSSDQNIIRYIVQPKNLGNGVIVMSQDRIPKYLRRKLGLI